MAEYFRGIITFPFGALNIPAVKKALEADGSPFLEKSVDKEEGTIQISDPQVYCGRFDDLEKVLKENQVPFTRDSAADYGFDAERRRYRPASENSDELDHTSNLTDSGKVSVDIKAISALLNVTPKKCKEELKQLINSVYPDAKPLIDWKDAFPPAAKLEDEKITYQELLTNLEGNPTEANLVDIAPYLNVDMSLPCNPSGFVLGFFLVEVQEGIAQLPYDEIKPDKGYEQINLNCARLLKPGSPDYNWVKNGVSDHLSKAQAANELFTSNSLNA